LKSGKSRKPGKQKINNSSGEEFESINVGKASEMATNLKKIGSKKKVGK
jgi:hypothetical protein